MIRNFMKNYSKACIKIKIDTGFFMIFYLMLIYLLFLRVILIIEYDKNMSL